MPSVIDILTDPSFPADVRQQALDRVHADPGLPKTSTTSSFWIKPKHDFGQTFSEALPTETDTVIIGSGITGASIARTLLQNDKFRSKSSYPSVVLLEARTICSGATGRNGGHILETADEYAEIADDCGVDDARKIMKFRLAHLKEMLAVAEELGLTEEAQARKVQFLSAYFGDEKWKAALERLRRFKEDMPEESAGWTSYEGDAIPEEFHLSRATGIVAGPGGALWPYKFVTGILSRLKTDYPNEFRVEENTPVTAIDEATSISTPRYIVQTSRGTILARHVIHCTNAHVAHLVPGLRGRIVPARGQMSAQTPGDAFPRQGSKHSWVFNYDRGFDYLTQLSEGQMMLGGGFAQSEHHGLADLGVSIDSEISLNMDIHLSGVLAAVFGRKNWGRVQGDPIQAMWTGIMAMSSDNFPWVGRLPEVFTRRADHGEEGSEWVCAAFGGEGMVQAWLSGKALGTMLLERDGVLVGDAVDLSWFPEQYCVSEKRFGETELPKEVVVEH